MPLSDFNLSLGDRVTNGKGNVWRVVNFTEDREVNVPGLFHIFLGPSVQVQSNNAILWVDAKYWHNGEWRKL
jgi:hypothetical protein